MNRTVITKAVLAMAMMLAGTALQAQIFTGEGSMDRSEHEKVLRRNFWQDFSNPVGIRQDTTVARSADASLKAEMEAGGFHRTWEADMPWNVGAGASALVHLKKFSMQGSFSFQQMQGSNMCGSIFVNPGFYPIDVLEFTPGRKIRQTYAFDGAISVDIAPEWRIGAGMDFTSANYAKRKDLRHSNYMLDMTLSPGVIWHHGKWAVGLNAILRKTSDTPVAKQIGTKETYDAFLDKGLMFGKLESWQGSGIHLDEAGVNGLPLMNMYYGAAAQMQYGNMFMGLDYRYGSGKAGEKQFVWYRFPSHNIRLFLGESWETGEMEHSLRVDLAYSELTNSETVIERQTEGGVTQVIEHGSNQILFRQAEELEVEYGLEVGKNEFEIGAGLEEELSTASQMYPFVAEENLVCWNVKAAYTRRISRFDLSFGLGYIDGLVRENEREVAENSGVSTEPYRLTEWYEKSIEYNTASRMCAGLSVGCDIWKGIYIKLNADYTHAFGIKLLPGADRFAGNLTFGYKF